MISISSEEISSCVESVPLKSGRGPRMDQMTHASVQISAGNERGSSGSKWVSDDKTGRGAWQSSPRRFCWESNGQNASPKSLTIRWASE